MLDLEMELVTTFKNSLWSRSKKNMWRMGMVTFPRQHQKEFIVAVLNATRIWPTEVLRTERPKMKKRFYSYFWVTVRQEVTVHIHDVYKENCKGSKQNTQLTLSTSRLFRNESLTRIEHTQPEHQLLLQECPSSCFWGLIPGDAQKVSCDTKTPTEKCSSSKTPTEKCLLTKVDITPFQEKIQCCGSCGLPSFGEPL